MQTTRRKSSILTTVLSLIVIFIAWLLLAPTQLGGQVSYVIVDGNSMEKGFHLGDLVLIRKASTYQIGDAVTYQNAELGRYVFHRIVNLNLDHFQLKGDNNTWFDSYQPNQAEIVGKLWVHIPKLGKAIEWLRQPINLAIAIALLGGSLMSNMLIQPAKQGKSKNTTVRNSGGIPEMALYIFGFLALAFLGLSVIGFTHSVTRIADDIPYQQDGTFFYSATGAPDVYDTNVVHSGEPIFPKLTCFLNVGFAYNLQSDQLQNIWGKHQFYARVLDEQSGWQRTLPMTAETAFVGSSYMTMATLDVCQVEALVSLVEQETGLHQNTYTLEIVPHVDMIATIDGNPIYDSFEPSLAFRFDKVHFYLAADTTQAETLHTTKQGLINNSNLQANSLSFLGLKPEVGTVRTIALLGLGLSLSGLLVVGFHLYSTAQSNPQALIQLKYGALLMDVKERVTEPLSPAIDVRRIEDLAKIAERQNTVILHMTLGLMDIYLVQSNGMTYRYAISNDSRAVVEVAPLVHQEILQYMLRNDVKTVIDSKPTQEVIYQDAHPVNWNKTPNAEPPEKVVMRYSMNVSRTHSKS